jgi:hypothetical protein
MSGTLEATRPKELPATERSWRLAFLQGLLETGSVIKACYRAGVFPFEAYQTRLKDRQFDADWEEVETIVAMERSGQIEDAVYERAVNGTRYTKFDKDGNVIETGTTPDTPAAKLLLQAYRPRRFVQKPKEDATTAVESVADLLRALADEHRARALPRREPMPAAALPDAKILRDEDEPLIRRRVN